MPVNNPKIIQNKKNMFKLKNYFFILSKLLSYQDSATIIGGTMYITLHLTKHSHL